MAGYIGTKSVNLSTTGADIKGNVTVSGTTFTLDSATVQTVDLGDNDRIRLGDSDDFQIYYSSSSSDSHITASGNLTLDPTGSLELAGNTNVTGTLTSDGLTVDGNQTLNGDLKISDVAVFINMVETDVTDLNTRLRSANGDFYIETINDALNSATVRLNVDHATGDISFYEDTGTTAKFFWDASAERLGLGTVSPQSQIAVSNAATTDVMEFDTAPGFSRFMSIDRTTGDEKYLQIRAKSIGFALDSGADDVTIDSSGNVGIGTTADQQSSAVNEGIWFSSGSNSSFSANSTPLIINRMGTGGNDRANITLHNNGTARADIGTLGASNGMYVAVGGSEAMRIDSSRNVLVGTTLSPTSLSSTSSEEGMAIGGDGLVVIANDGQSPLVLNRLSSDGNILNFNKDGATVGSIGAKAGDLVIGTTITSLRFNNGLDVIHPFNQTSGVGSDANTDLGASSARFKDLHLSGNIAASNSSSLQFGSTSCAIEGTSSGADYIKITTNSSEAMRISSSGDLFVSKTSSDTGVVGVELGATGYGAFCRDANKVGIFNRKTSNGTILDFKKDGTSIGSIGVHSEDQFFISRTTGSHGIKFRSSGAIPCNASGSDSDNDQDLGISGVRWDDIYATNGTIQTSDRNEKQDIAELSDAEQRVAVAAKGLLRKFRWRDAVAEKGDEARTHFGIIAQDLQAAFAAEGLDAGDYAMFISSTWWETQTEVPAVEAVAEVLDEEGNTVTEAVEAVDAYTLTDTYETQEEAPEGATERTRLGVRYSELLAFIIGAL
jgi:hypothetical protein